MPNGMRLMNRLQELWRKEHKKQAYDEIKTPTMLDKELWEISGHWFNYRENMYTSEIDVNKVCYKTNELPRFYNSIIRVCYIHIKISLKYAEMGHVHRHEYSGVYMD